MSKRKRPLGDPMLAVGYVRVSTEEQTLEAQHAALQRWAKRTGVTLLFVFEDKISGATPIEERPGLTKALSLLHESGAGILVAPKRDRFARSTLVSSLLELHVSKEGAVIRTADGASDGTGDEGSLMRDIFDAFAKHERNIIRTRTKAKLDAKKAMGEVTGHPRYGLQLAEDKIHTVPHEYEQTVINTVRILHETGTRTSDILRQVNAKGYVSRVGKPFSRTQIGNILDRLREVAC